MNLTRVKIFFHLTPQDMFHPVNPRLMKYMQSESIVSFCLIISGNYFDDNKCHDYAIEDKENDNDLDKTNENFDFRSKKCGRKRKTSRRNEAFLLRNSKPYPTKTSYDLQQDLEEAKVKVHDYSSQKTFGRWKKSH